MFNADTTAHGIEALRQYRRASDEKAKTFSDTPHRDWTTDIADAARYMAIAAREIAPPPPLVRRKSRRRRAEPVCRYRLVAEEVTEAAALRPSISAFHWSAFSERTQTTFMYCAPPACTRSVRASIVCAFNAHITGLSTCGPRTKSSAVSGWQSECESAVEQIRITIE